jgi:hypothetical protein
VRESSKLVMGRKLFHDLTQHHRKPIMRATLISFMLATAPAFGSAAYGQVTAADSVTSATEATEAQDGKADALSLPSSSKRRPDGRAAAWLGVDFVHVAFRDAATRD